MVARVLMVLAVRVDDKGRGPERLMRGDDAVLLLGAGRVGRRRPRGGRGRKGGLEADREVHRERGHHQVIGWPDLG